jgi:hypothetical protein
MRDTLSGRLIRCRCDQPEPSGFLVWRAVDDPDRSWVLDIVCANCQNQLPVRIPTPDVYVQLSLLT